MFLHVDIKFVHVHHVSDHDIDRFSFMPLSSMTKSVTTGFPIVSVPVLSSATVSILYAFSSASPPFKIIPNFAARPIPTTSAVGVARPMAHGHEMTRTAIIFVRAGRSWSGTNTKYQTQNVSTERKTAVGTKYSLILSTRS